MGVVGSLNCNTLFCSLEIENDLSLVGNEGSAQSLPMTSGVTVFRGRKGSQQSFQVPTWITAGFACSTVRRHTPWVEAIFRESLFCLNRSFNLKSESVDEEPTPPTAPTLAASCFQSAFCFIYISQEIFLRSSLESIP